MDLEDHFLEDHFLGKLLQVLVMKPCSHLYGNIDNSINEST